ncbi:hypothetical protein HN385_03790 [archaeon]|nr:hypothetical protein [archaeon]MBT3450870.1 hypothetical protein [archaeon]MBT6869052.1 hypothetical protein [archaeon]MBT7193295.1 hypothetical protein [archaeon]MBT7380303.1 hypothetical protein [archaeon]
MKTEDKILNFLKYSGPSLAMKIAKNIKEDSIIASAYLSELASKRKIKISKLKIGTSPLYYLPGQEDQLIRFTQEINPKNRDVLENLQKWKVLRENDLELLAKVALRSLQDFAIPLHVNFNGQKELFWKWYLLGDDETNNIISDILTGLTPITNNDTRLNSNNQEVQPEQVKVVQTQETQQNHQHNQYNEIEPEKEEVKSEVKEVPKEVVQEKEEIKQGIEIKEIQEKQPNFESYPPNTAQNIEPLNRSNTYPPNTAITGRGGNVWLDQKEINLNSEESKSEVKEDSKEVVKEKEEIKKEIEVKTETEIKEITTKAIDHEKDIKKQNEKNQIKLSDVKEKETDKEYEKNADIKETKDLEKVSEDERPKGKKSFMSIIKDKFSSKYKKKIDKGFLDKVSNYLDSLDVKIENKEIVRKNSELNFIINVPSTIGKIKYFCKAKNKNKCDEKDLSAAYMESQMKKMPLLFLYSCDINKKAIEMLESKAFDNLIIKRIDREV